MGSLIDAKLLKKKIVEAIEKNKLIFVEDCCAYSGISDPTFYTKFPVGSDDFNDITELLEKNKIAIKVSLRKKWHESNCATRQMALYKLCSTKEEHRLLQQNYVDHNMPVNPLTIDEIEVKVSNEATSH